MRLFNNPIFQREFVSTARSWKTNFLVWGFLLLLAGVMLMLWPESGIHSVVSEGSKMIFWLFFNLNLTLMILIVPAFSATSITFEKENDTYPALFTTLLTPLDIVFGKLSAAVLMLAILVLLSMPIGAVCALTGGVSLMLIFKVMSLIMVAALTYGLIGLACSSFCKRSSSAILLNYVFILLLAGATWLPSALLKNLLGFNEVWLLLRNLSPYDALWYLLYPDNYRMSLDVQFSMPSPYLVYLCGSALISALALHTFYRKILRPSSQAKAQEGEFYTGGSQAIKRKLSWPFYLLDPLKRKKPIGRFSNPVFVSEMRSKLFANPRFVIRTVSGIFILSLILLTLISFQFGDLLRADTVRMVAIVFQIGVVAMLAPGVSSGLITDEITSGTLTALRMTQVKPSAMIFGKLQATFFYAMIFIVSSLFVLLAMAYLEPQDVFPEGSFFSSVWWNEVLTRAKDPEWVQRVWGTYYRLVVWIGILLLSTISFLTGGLFASSVSRTTSMATAISYALTSIICLVTFAPLLLAERLPHGVSALILSFNPVAAAMQATSDAAFVEYPGLWQHNIMALGGLTLFFLAAAIARAWQLFNRQD
ncbi:MAG: hypothetical protein A2X49_05820 [Lentisphaerae bacterium GWF2_52_8]|nr:MAG: hypothetical protein A2X49_05820 [Lentisphaerae bacterium GWF2_52_8]